MKILNLYAGIGGNRWLWGDQHEITAVELEPDIASVYRHFFPNDTVIEADAHQYLLDHFREFDFIWASPPCPTHSRLNSILQAQGFVRYPDMRLYQEIIFLKHFFKGKWLIENVEPYYAVLIQPTTFFDRHCFWSNFPIPTLPGKSGQMERKNTITSISAKFGITLPPGTKNGRKLLRNAVRPEIGSHILEAAMRNVKQASLL